MAMENLFSVTVGYSLGIEHHLIVIKRNATFSVLKVAQMYYSAP